MQPPSSSGPTTLDVALTGNVASGKSTVAGVWRKAGVPVVSADDLSRQAVEPGSPALDEIESAFGRDLLRPDGTMDRDRMRDLVFRDPAARKRLEGILHPRIMKLRREWVEARRREGHAFVVSEIPLLFEAKLEGESDLVVVVNAPSELRRARLVESRGIHPEEADRMMATQGDPGEKVAGADLVIHNEGPLVELEAAAARVLDDLSRRAGERR
jgi:dephospho-CoA kinase